MMELTMKIRNGFVSNSSTSSFLVLGWRGSLDEDDMKTVCEEFNLKPDSEDKEDLVDILQEDINFFIDEDLEIWGIELMYTYEYGLTESTWSEIEDQCSTTQTIQTLLSLPDPTVFLGQRH